MKFVPLFDEVTSMLNFSSLDCRVIGGCDLYTTKAAGSDKKLYRDIEFSLESQYESLLKYSVSISPRQEELGPMNLSRPSPFGPLSQISSRRTYAFLIATLNASHPDYDFSHILSPTDFRRERSLKTVINTIDSTLKFHRSNSGLGPQAPSQAGYSSIASSSSSSPTSASSTTQSWGSHIWSLIDKEMVLQDCTVYCWEPPDQPFDGGDEGSIWSFNYFFFNKALKRVTYLHARAVPSITHSPETCIESFRGNISGYESGAYKRARYWLGDKAYNVTYMDQTDLDEEVNNNFLWKNESEVDFENTSQSFDGEDSSGDDNEADNEPGESDEANSTLDSMKAISTPNMDTM